MNNATEQPATMANLPEVAVAWQEAWNGTDPARLGELFTTDGTYTDHAISVSDAFRHGDHVAIQSVYSGHINGAPTPFAVPMCTVLDLRHDQISKKPGLLQPRRRAGPVRPARRLDPGQDPDAGAGIAAREHKFRRTRQ